MLLKQHYSGSSGNLYEITANNGSRLLIDPGIKWADVLEALNYNLKGIEGALCSHLHSDHSQALKDVIQAGINVYANEDTFESHGLLSHRRAKLVADKTLVRLGTFEVYCFDLHHDVPILGFIIRDKTTNEFMLFCTDTSHISQKFKYPFQIIAVECSYNREYLAKRVREKTIHEELAKRLLSSHMEEKEALRYITEFCDGSKLEQVHLLHCSADNINKTRIKKTFEKELLVEVITI